MITAINKLPNKTIELTLTIPWNDVKKDFDEVVREIAQNVELPGFRKGKAPIDMVKKSLTKQTLYEKVLGKIIPKAYIEAVNENKLKPIVNPKIEVIKAEEGEDWVCKATTCEMPEIDLKDYRKKIDSLFAKEKIWIPGKEEKKPEDTNKQKEDYLQKIVDILLETVKIDIPDMLIEEEANRLLSNLLDQTQKLGLTVEQYLASRNITSEQIRAQYATQAKNSLALEFILEKIADEENIEVTDKEIESLIEKTADNKEKESLNNQKSYIKAILRRQKTLDSLVKPIS
jgi:FKBP-type peptidyl-prolyl cis-trans isomerase (trigger factor)